MNPARDLAAEWNDPRASDVTRREAARRAVNALPAIADLLDALGEYLNLPHPVHSAEADLIAARDRVAAALTGDTDG